jgi:hypothetical protein
MNNQQYRDHCSRCGLLDRVIGVFLRPVQERVPGKATQFRSPVLWWCPHCRKEQHGKYRFVTRETDSRPVKPVEVMVEVHEHDGEPD